MKVIVIKRFLNYGLGPADVPDKDVPRLKAKGLIEVPDGSLDGVPNMPASVSYPDDQLEPIAARISAGLGIERSSDETPLQFLERFAGECESVAQSIEERLTEQKNQFDASFQQAQDEIATLTTERDEALAHREEAVAENEKLKAENDAFKAAQAEAEKAEAEKAEAEKAKGKGK